MSVFTSKPVPYSKALSQMRAVALFCWRLFIITLLHASRLTRPRDPKVVQTPVPGDLVHYSETSKRQFAGDPFVKAVKHVLINEALSRKKRGNVAGRNWNRNVLSQKAPLPVKENPPIRLTPSNASWWSGLLLIKSFFLVLWLVLLFGFWFLS